MKKISDDIDFLKFVGTQESQFISNPSEFTDDVLKRFSGDEELIGDKLPWSKTHNLVRMRPGEFSVWAGINGHGKSQLLGQICAWNLHKRKWLIASLEMKPAATMHRMVRQVSGNEMPHEDYIKRFLNWTDDKLWIYDQHDTVKQNRILGMVHYAAQELGVEHIVIDSLMKCGIPKDDTEGQAAFIDRLCWAAKSENIHIHLVHHVRKGDSETNIPGKFDVRGASEITDLADNVFIVHRNKGKEIRMASGGEVGQDEPDCTLVVAKQRHGEWEGRFNLWFNGESMQYTPNENNKPLPFIPGNISMDKVA